MQQVKVADMWGVEESRWQVLMEHAHELIAVADLDGIVVEANRKWEELLCLPPGGLVGRHISEIAAIGSTEATQVPVRRGDGGVALIDFTTSTVVLDGRPVVLSIGHDVTEQARTAARLRASEERYRGLIERLPEVVWSGTADGMIHFISGNVASICGVSRETVYAGGAP